MVKEPVLRISEQFYSLQGEGKTMGVPSVFVRLQACNILCKGEWVCDTIDVWKTGKKTSITQWLNSIEKYVRFFKKGTHLIFTGGEPLLQQKGIQYAVKEFEKRFGFKPYIEIETNGTMMPTHDTIKIVDLFNCSFKLANSGVREDRRLKYDVLAELNQHHTIFKIVVGTNMDFLEAEKTFNRVGIKHKDIWLMPPGDNIEDIMKQSPITAEICIREGYNFSSRLQVVLWNLTTGV